MIMIHTPSIELYQKLTTIKIACQIKIIVKEEIEEEEVEEEEQEMFKKIQ